jgi:hypothetical protein
VSGCKDTYFFRKTLLLSFSGAQRAWRQRPSGKSPAFFSPKKNIPAASGSIFFRCALQSENFWWCHILYDASPNFATIWLRRTPLRLPVGQ